MEIDNEVTINARNRIRLCAILCLFGVLLYLNVYPYFTLSQVSFLHQAHLGAQPLMILSTLIDNVEITYVALGIILLLTLLDVVISVVNFVAISRCFNEPSASCFDRLYENGIWFILGVYFVIFDLNIALQSYSLNRQMLSLQEERTVLASKDKKPPYERILYVFKNKMRTLNIFMIVFDMIYLFLMFGESVELIMIGFVHGFIDIFCVLSENKSREKTIYVSLICVFSISILAHTYALFVLSENVDMVDNMLSILIATTFVLTDIMQIGYAVSIHGLVDKIPEVGQKSKGAQKSNKQTEPIVTVRGNDGYYPLRSF